MSRRGNEQLKKQFQQSPKQTPRKVESLLDVMQDGNEYQSIVDTVLKGDILDEVIEGLNAIEAIRNRRCLLYAGDVVGNKSGPSGIDLSDDLPFHEMVDKIPTKENKIDVFVSTLGGSGHQVNRYVNALRTRFKEVDFIIPSFCMSAGTLFALSGDNIWMTERACLGPIDPQIPTKEGQLVPAQALMLLVSKIQEQGQAAIDSGSSVPWTAVRIIDTIDKKELANAISASDYSKKMAKEFLINYKFKNWTTKESSESTVTPKHREERAAKIAEALASHDKWKAHGHALSRKVLWDEIELKIEHPDIDFNKSIVRLWALCNYIFDKTKILKMIISADYKFVRLTKV